MSLLPSLKPAAEIAKITAFIKKTTKAAKFAKLIVATSGGVDSSLSLALAAQAFGPANVVALKLPYGVSHPKSLEHAQLAIKHAKIPRRNVVEANIGASVDKTWEQILIKLSHSQTGNNPLTNQIRLGNIMARIRMVYLFDTARAHRALVVGTENKSEMYLGYFTRFGDEASDIEPIRHLYKTQVRQLAAYLKLPQLILDQAPTAGLWADQTDETELGFTYTLADQVLYLSFDKKMSSKEITQTIAKEDKTIPEAKLGKLVTKVLARVKDADFKHLLPYHL